MENVNATYVFRVHYYDSQGGTTKEFLLFYYLASNTVELYDTNSRRLFLKRCKAPPSLEEQLYINNTIHLVSRQLKIVDYGDERTRRLLAAKRVTKVGIIVKPHAHKYVGEILQRLLDAELTLSYVHMSRTRCCDEATLHQGTEACAGETAAVREESSASASTRVPLVEIEVVGRDADQRVASVAGPSDPATAKEQAPTSLRGLYGVSREENVVAIVGRDDDWSSSEREAYARAADNAFPRRSPPSSEAVVADRSCCVVKPSGLKHAGSIIRDITEAGFKILAMQSFHLTKNAADEFYEVYHHVLKEQPLMVDELTSGMCIAMHVEHPEKDTVKRLRELTDDHANFLRTRFFLSTFFVSAGPFDSEMARTLRPTSLRAKYGTDRVRNGVHCTDLPEDGELEVHYFFHVLADALTHTCASA
ncbi:UNVERIFIED_CONTAM: hypothetical protein H355_011763 [Colinus virginianus]|nr:hypothetical protein H355_011763 [Colinus virginianus]